MIEQANATIHVTPNSVTYDGDPHTASGTATGVKGETLAGLVLSDTTHTNAGNYNTDSWSFTDATGNYKNVAATTITDVINQATANIPLRPTASHTMPPRTPQPARPRAWAALTLQVST